MSWQTGGNAVRNLLFRIAGDKYRDLVLIALSWERAVGSTMAERSFVDGFRHGILFIGVSNSVWIQELSLNKQMILQRLNAEVKNKIKDIVFYIKSST
jgi:predicted nucleic acid-binding Zn ribbon protein